MDQVKGKASPLVSKVHGKEKRWSAEFAALRKLCLGSGLNEELKWGQACYDFHGGKIVLIHGFKDYCALLFMKGALLKDPEGILVQQTKNVQSARQIRFTSPAEINKQKAAVAAYINEAIAVERSGAKVQKKAVADYEMAGDRRVICCILRRRNNRRPAPRAWRSMRREFCGAWGLMIDAGASFAVRGSC
jgi:uncharacterized protein YdeI (YjbR/CyaY-like superfamily)